MLTGPLPSLSETEATDSQINNMSLSRAKVWRTAKAVCMRSRRHFDPDLYLYMAQTAACF